MFRQLFLLLIAASANATTVSPGLHECPVCSVKSVTMSLASYSQFGEPARDLSDFPQFLFAAVEVCPGDLYASWADAWKAVDAEEKSKLTIFLKQPFLHLKEAEKAVISDHEKAFRESSWFEPIWARTCDGFRNNDQRRNFRSALRLHFAGRYLGGDRTAEEWEKQLVALFRENAIAALKNAATAKWPKLTEKRIFAYLRAELTRQAGRDEEAFSLFQEVIASEKTAKPDKELAWISRWASEQSLRSSPDAKDPDKLLAAIIPMMPDPWRDQKAAEDPRWPRHFAAVDVLVQCAASGEKPFSAALWKLLDRKPERLLALLETSDSDVSPLRQVDPGWREWFDEIAARLDSGKLPLSLAGDPNDTRVTNVLRRAVGGTDARKLWRKEILLPMVLKSVAEGGIPEPNIPNDHSLPWLPPLVKETPAKAVAKPPFNELSRELYQLWEEHPSARPDIARIYIRLLRQAAETWESTQYPAMYFLPAIAETEEGREVIRKELDGQWTSSFWKAACAYAARLPDSTDAFTHHPFTAKADNGLVFKMLTQRSDASWRDDAIAKLNKDDWISSELISYLVLLDLPETKSALETFATRIRNQADDPKKTLTHDGKLSALQDIDSARVKARLRALPIR